MAGQQQPAASQRFTAAERIRRRAEFQRVFDAGVRASGRLMTLVIRRNDLDVTRLGLVVSRKLGSAVRRNRLKRLAREVFRHNKIEPGFDIVLIPRREMLDAAITHIEADYRSAIRRRDRAR